MSIHKKNGFFSPTPSSLADYNTPEWFRDAKFGIFIHWGIYSVPAWSSEWYPRSMYASLKDQKRPHPGDAAVYFYHRLRYGGPQKTGYKDFIPQFKAEKWDPKIWAKCFKDWGARYVVPVGEHHDGFPMYATKHTHWNAAEMGPKRDIVEELRKAILAEEMHFGISTHRAWNWGYYRYRHGEDTTDPANEGLYGTPHDLGAEETDEFLNDWRGRVREMMDRFHPELMYFDFGWHRPRFDSHRPEVAAEYYNHGLEHGYEPVLNYKNQGERAGSAGFEEGSAVLDIERGGSAETREHPWQTCTSVGNRSWGYITNEVYSTGEHLAQELSDTVSKNGNMLINIGPRPDGTIPKKAQKSMASLGEWLKINGEAIYATRPWTQFGEGPTRKRSSNEGFDEKPLKYTHQDFRFTRPKGNLDEQPDKLYAIQMAPKKSQKVLIRSAKQLQGIQNVTCLDGTTLEWKKTSEGIEIHPLVPPKNKFPRVFTLTTS